MNFDERVSGKLREPAAAHHVTPPQQLVTWDRRGGAVAAHSPVPLRQVSAGGRRGKRGAASCAVPLGDGGEKLVAVSGIGTGKVNSQRSDRLWLERCFSF